MKTNFIPQSQVKINDKFWSPKQLNVCDNVIPYQYNALNDTIEGAEPSHAIENFKIAAGEKNGDFYGWFFQDSDVAKWIEAASYSLEIKPNKELEKNIDELIELIGRAQQPDGYLHTYVTVKQPEHKFENLLEWHELYCMGHMIEAAVAYYNATKKDILLKIMCKMADYAITRFGHGEGKIAGYPGHEEVELGLYKLYEVTKQQKYFDLLKFFIDERGKKPFYYDEEEKLGMHVWNKKGHSPAYQQSHLPVREQTTAEGHSVRAVYLYSGMADMAYETEDKEIIKALDALWENMTQKRMYITGAIGSQAAGERFTIDYDLPSATAYAETCASIGAMMWAKRMLKLDLNSKYADLIEKELYNGILSGISLKGTEYFYVNPLEVIPSTAHYRADMQHIKTQRVQWFGCACCPPNVARLLTSLSSYIYSQNNTEIAVHLYMGNNAEFEINGNKVSIVQNTQYPWNNVVEFSVNAEQSFTLALRIPSWCNNYSVKVNGEDFNTESVNGYIKIKRMWKQTDKVTLFLDMSVKVMRSNTQVANTCGKVAIMRGPVVYCAEQIDNGKDLSALVLDTEKKMTEVFEENVLNGVVTITAEAVRLVQEEELYTDAKIQKQETKVKLIPYYAWGNRGEGEMRVWLKEKI